MPGTGSMRHSAAKPGNWSASFRWSPDLDSQPQRLTGKVYRVPVISEPGSDGFVPPKIGICSPGPTAGGVFDPWLSLQRDHRAMTHPPATASSVSGKRAVSNAT